jgi:MFS family permease
VYNTYLIQLFTNSSVVLSTIFIPLFAQSLGATPVAVGMLVGIYNLMLFVSSTFFGRLSDIHERKLFIVLGLVTSAVVIALHIFIRTLPSMFLLRALAGLCGGIFPAALMALVYEKKNGLLGRFTAYGSLGWGIGSIVAGVLAVYNRLFLLAALFYLVSFFIGLSLKEEKQPQKLPLFPWDVIKRNLSVYLSFFLRHTGAFAIWAIFPLYLAYLGANKFWIGVIYALNAVGQFLIMPHLDRFKSTRLVDGGLILSIVTFIIFALCRNYKQILPAQLLLALSWSALYLGSLKYLMERNVERSTSIGIFNSLSGLSGIVGPILGGVAGNFGYRAVMILAAVMSLAGFILPKIYSSRA